MGNVRQPSFLHQSGEDTVCVTSVCTFCSAEVEANAESVSLRSRMEILSAT